jgi:hypothetical protein
LPGILEKGPPLGSLGKWGVRLASWLSSGVRSSREARVMSPIGTTYVSGIGPAEKPAEPRDRANG